MGPKGQKCWCMIIWFCKKKNKSLIWHRTPNDKKTSSPLLKRKKYFPVARIGFSGLFLFWLGVYLVQDSGPQRLIFRFRNFSVSRLCHFFRVSENLVAKKVSVSVSKNCKLEVTWDQTISDLLVYNLQLPYKNDHCDFSSRSFGETSDNYLWREIPQTGQTGQREQDIQDRQDTQEKNDWCLNLTACQIRNIRYKCSLWLQRRKERVQC